MYLLEGLLAALGIVLLSPVFMAVASAILVEDGMPVFYRQKRIGLCGHPFYIWKFRSMRPAPGAMVTSSTDARITHVGRFLRSYKIDELPQLVNVLKGEISFVGPRPEVSAYVNPSEPAWQRVLAIKPGITDLATLIYRNEEELLAQSTDPDRLYREVILPAKLQLNGEYHKVRSLKNDVKLLFLTAWYSVYPHSLDPPRLQRVFLKTR
jgi:lipopolysaccharide/colanic/teichoic acid biosynthesis glycosyltransferase